MGRRGLLGPALASLALLIAGCGGGDGPTLTFDGTDEEQIAATVNTMTAAIAAGEGAVACELMTDRGQQAMIRFGRQVFDTEGVTAASRPSPSSLMPATTPVTSGSPCEMSRSNPGQTVLR